jgi:GrpB-like predicted nucleotidyltransferase (UPF0157 family)
MCRIPPFPKDQNDQVDPDDKVTLTPWRTRWDEDFSILSNQLRNALGPLALRVDHIGSTSVPELSSKDVIDVQVTVERLDRPSIVDAMRPLGFKIRDTEWNFQDHIPAGWHGDPRLWSKLVFAPPPGTRASNVHVRVSGSPNERYALLFRDFLRADGQARMAWGRFKQQAAENTRDLSHYGAIKDPATDVLLILAERWAKASDWTVPGR